MQHTLAKVSEEIMKKVRGSASEITTVLGGVCWIPIAVRKNESTITIRVNEVIIIRIDGASDKTVVIASSCTIRPVNVPFSWSEPKFGLLTMGINYRNYLC